MNNSEQSQSGVSPTELRSDIPVSGQQTSGSEKRQLWHGSLLDQNSVLELLLKIIGGIVLLYALRDVIVSTVRDNESLIASMTSGCEVPPGLMTERFVPEPLPCPGDPTIEQEIQCGLDREAQLLSVLVNVLNDRRELREICSPRTN